MYANVQQGAELQNMQSTLFREKKHSYFIRSNQANWWKGIKKCMKTAASTGSGYMHSAYSSILMPICIILPQLITCFLQYWLLAIYSSTPCSVSSCISSQVHMQMESRHEMQLDTQPNYHNMAEHWAKQVVALNQRSCVRVTPRVKNFLLTVVINNVVIIYIVIVWRKPAKRTRWSS